LDIERAESKITDIDDISLEKVNKQRANSASSAYIESSSITSSTSRNKSKTIENVLILQGGGSLGAFGCGVFKALAKRNIKIDIIAGTSIGGVNAAIVAGSKNEEHPEKLLEEFWLELSNSFVDLKENNLSYFGLPHFMAESLSKYYYSYPVLGSKDNEKENSTKKTREEIRLAQFRSFATSAIFGNDKMFKPRWRLEYASSDPEYFSPQKWTYLYDHSPLEKTLEKYIDYEKLKPEGNANARLIITATNILTAQPLIFDSAKQQITAKHILASSGYPLYNFPWVEVEKGVYGWDGSLLSNTPLREVIAASPVRNKRIFLVENYPKKVDTLPANIPEVYHRARDIMFCDKTEHNVTMSKVITRYLQYIEELYQIVEKHTDHKKLDKKQLRRIRRKYKKYREERGAEIKQMFYISREEDFPHYYENADFSPEAIKYSIEKGEMKTDQVIGNIRA
jgi:NTE family protein